MAGPSDAHEWVSFEDATEDRTWVVDVTFMLSSWRCIFGAGCQGVLTGPAEELVQGCCSYGAHFSSEEDATRVEAAARDLGAEEWQFREIGLAEGVVERGEETTTMLVDDACIFLNRPEFEGGPGCALHVAALRRGVPHLELKPEVCWQLPLRREDLADSQGHVTSMIGEWDRHHWGPAGEEFHWWCTDAPEAFVGDTAVYQSLAGEIAALMGEENFAAVRGYLEDRRSGTVALAHPALRRHA